jgi:hypothetical protein
MTKIQLGSIILGMAMLGVPVKIAEGADVVGPGIAATGVLPTTLRCKALGWPTVKVCYATAIEFWCDPGNLDLLQKDSYENKDLSGNPGDYNYSTTGIPCTAGFPDKVRRRLCTVPPQTVSGC